MKKLAKQCLEMSELFRFKEGQQEINADKIEKLLGKIRRRTKRMEFWLNIRACFFFYLGRLHGKLIKLQKRRANHEETNP